MIPVPAGSVVEKDCAQEQGGNGNIFLMLSKFI